VGLGVSLEGWADKSEEAFNMGKEKSNNVEALSHQNLVHVGVLGQTKGGLETGGAINI
jgi:hypothetical protein